MLPVSHSGLSKLETLGDESHLSLGSGWVALDLAPRGEASGVRFGSKRGPRADDVEASRSTVYRNSDYRRSS
jgi:hypothetical protein